MKVLWKCLWNAVLRLKDLLELSSLCAHVRNPWWFLVCSLFCNANFSWRESRNDYGSWTWAPNDDMFKRVNAPISKATFKRTLYMCPWWSSSSYPLPLQKMYLWDKCGQVYLFDHSTFRNSMIFLWCDRYLPRFPWQALSCARYTNFHPATTVLGLP